MMIRTNHKRQGRCLGSERCLESLHDWTSALVNSIVRTNMARKYRDIVGMQLDMLVKTKRYNELNPTRPTRRASGEIVTDPKTGLKFKVVG